MSRSLSQRNLLRVCQDSQGARCFSCAGWPHVDRNVEILNDGTVICPDCGVDAVVPASKVLSEAELHAWRYLAFFATEKDLASFATEKEKGESRGPPHLGVSTERHKEAKEHSGEPTERKHERKYSSAPSESNHKYALRMADRQSPSPSLRLLINACARHMHSTLMK